MRQRDGIISTPPEVVENQGLLEVEGAREKQAFGSKNIDAELKDLNERYRSFDVFC
jgi:hypothetical protein